MELHPSSKSFQRQTSANFVASQRPNSLSDREQRKKLLRNENLHPENFQENILIGGSPIVGHRLAGAYPDPSKDRDTGGPPTHSRSMSSLAVPSNPLIHVSHSRGGSGRSIDVLGSSAPPLHSRGGSGRSLDLLDFSAPPFHSRAGSGKSIDVLDSPASPFHSRGGSGRSLDLDSATIFQQPKLAFNANQLGHSRAETYEDSGSNIRRDSTKTFGVSAALNPPLKTKYPKKGGQLLSKLAGTSFSASFH